jgi:hypothetical protein
MFPEPITRGNFLQPGAERSKESFQVEKPVFFHEQFLLLCMMSNSEVRTPQFGSGPV